MATKQQHDLTTTLCSALLADYEEHVHPQAGRVITAIPEGIAQTVLDAIPDGWAKIDGEWVEVESISAGEVSSDYNHPQTTWMPDLLAVKEA